MSKKTGLNRALVAIKNGMSISAAYRKFGIKAGYAYGTFYRHVKKYEGMITVDALLISRLSVDRLPPGDRKASMIIRIFLSDIEASLDGGMPKKEVLAIINSFFGVSIAYSYFCRMTEKKRQKSLNQPKPIKQQASKNNEAAPNPAGRFTQDTLKNCDFLTQEEKNILCAGVSVGANAFLFSKAVQKYIDHTELNDSF